MADIDEVIRSYLTALKDPDALRDDDAIAELENGIESSDDPIERLQLRQQVLDAKAGLRGETWGAPSDTCGAGSVPRDAAVQK